MQIRRTGRQRRIHHEVVHFVTVAPTRCCNTKPTSRGTVLVTYSLFRTFVVCVIERVVRRIMTTSQTSRSQDGASLTLRHGTHRLFEIVPVFPIQYGCSWSTTAGATIHPRTRRTTQRCIFSFTQAGKMPTSRKEYPD